MSKPSSCLSGGAHEFLGNTSVSDARCKKCTFEYDGWVVGVNRSKPTDDVYRGQQALELLRELVADVDAVVESREHANIASAYRWRAKALLKGAADD